jgi:glutamine amidotransferase
MCRLFGFRSVIPSQVHRSLIQADNALCTQSQRHPDGWGVAYYVDGAPHVVKSAETAHTDHLFHKIGGVVASETVLAHVRKATVGVPSILNCHPFQYGRWVFAHNGTIAEFEEVRGPILGEVAPRLRRYIMGETDSEVVFYLFLGMLERRRPLGAEFEVDEVIDAMGEAVRRVREICDARPCRKAALTLLATNGTTLVATRGGRDLHWSTYKTRCRDRDTCASLAYECENPTLTGSVNHLIISSEPLGGDNIWLPVQEDDAIGVDARMLLVRRSLRDRLPVVA